MNNRLPCWSVLSLGKVDSQRPYFHDAYHIWPIGYKVSWSDSAGSSFNFEILDGKNLSKNNHLLHKQTPPYTQLFPTDAPVFKAEHILITKSGDKSEDFYGLSASDVWAQLSLKHACLLSGVDNSFGLESPEIQLRIENLDGASECEDYEFLNQRSNLIREDEIGHSRKCPRTSSGPARAQRNYHTSDGCNQDSDTCPSDWPSFSNLTRGTPMCAVGGPAEVLVRYTQQGCGERDQLATSQGQHADEETEDFDLWIPATARRIGKSGGARAYISLCDGTTFKMRLGDARLRWNPDNSKCASRQLAGLAAATMEEAERVPEIAVEMIELVAMLHAFRSAWLVSARLMTSSHSCEPR